MDQILSMTKFIENKFEEKKVVREAFIKFPAEYDTISQWILLENIYNLTKYIRSTQIKKKALL